ncbi:nuclear autoantigenic sperm protein isoform X2 [Scleropages formosus]|uniref:nuclear autoantigenic sperm protein isoform X2 n=1 Tax=Scleropages formosus TaxID=113540 RepID=UPI0008783901|nr:histone-binding protein N1/N2-like isoform X2 [Scleropages formosus]
MTCTALNPRHSTPCLCSMDEEKPCCSTSASHSAAGIMEEAKKLMGTGKRHLVMGDAVSAVAVLQEACAMLAKRYGDTADECGEAFFLYGKALLELARLENTVLGNALDGVPEEESEAGEKLDDSKIESADNVDEETKAELREQVYDAMSEREAEKSKMEDGEKERETSLEKESVKSPLKDCAPSQKDEMMADGSEKSSEGKDSEEEGPEVKGEKAPSKELQKDGGAEKMEEDGEEDGGGDDEDDESEAEEDKENEEEVGNLQLAWEMLEVAKVIYKRKENKDDQLLAAQAHLKLGEISVESGNYSQALEDFQECLAIQLKHLPSHSRMLAETQYQLGLTFGYTSQYNKAIQHFNNSIQVIESCLALQEAIDKAEGSESVVEEQKEMEELKQLLPDIREKVEDAQESQKTAVIASEAIQQTLTGHSSGFPTENGATSSSMATTSTVGASSSKSASDISHLVRKKRKPEESPVKNVDSKKAKQEAALNGGENC